MNAVKKLFLLLLSLTLLVGAFSVVASAEDSGTESEGTESNLAFTYQVGDGEVQSVASLGSPEADGEQFHTILNDLSNVKIKMYSDIVLTKGVLFGTMNDPVEVGEGESKKTYAIKLKTSGNVDWDLNGCTVTVTEDAEPLRVQMPSNDKYHSFTALHYIGTYAFKLYSSVPGGEYINNSSHAICGAYKYAEECPSYLFGTNEAEVCGEDNLTVTTNGPLVQGYEVYNASKTPLGAYLYMNGGTYVYNGNAAMVLLSDTNKMYNATIVTTGAAQAVFANHYYRASTTYADNLVVLAKNDITLFIANGDHVGIREKADASRKHAINVGNVILIGAGLKTEYNAVSAVNTYTVSGNVLASEKATLDVAYPTAPDGKTLAYAGITVNGENVVVQGYVAESETVTVTNQTTGEAEKWIAKDGYFYVLRNASTSDVALKKNGVWYCYTNPTWVATLDGNAIEMNTICDASNAGKNVALEITSDNVYPIAFSYQVDGGEVQFVETKGTPEEDGANFVTLLDKVCNVKIVMYTDIVLSTGVRFGTMVDVEVTYTKDNKTTTATTQRPYYTGPGKDPKSSEYGTVDWDLNGNTVTVAADATAIPMIAWTEGQGPQSNSVLHYPGYVNFRLYSSVAGGEYINLSTHTIFGINKYSNASYCLGAGDDNLTIVSKGQITGAYETGENGPAGYTLTVNGGTYVSSTGGAVFSAGKTIKINNAKILATGSAFAIFSNHFWSDGTSLTLDNVTMIASSRATQMVTSGAFSVANGNGKAHTIYLNNTIAFAGGTLELAYTKATFTVNGTIMTDTAENLAVAYPTAPEGQTLAYTGISVYGTLGKFAAYYTDPTVVIVDNKVTGTKENWIVGSAFAASGDVSALKVVVEDGKYYYRENPTLSATLEGAPIAMDAVCAEENAGKTVVLNVEGDKLPLYFGRTLDGATTYYYGDVTQANTDLVALLKAPGSVSSTVTLYSDFTLSASGMLTIPLGGKNHYFDLNGYTFVMDVTGAKYYSMKFQNGSMWFYSSREGGVMDVSSAPSAICADSSGCGRFGEAVADATEYGKNFTLKCRSFCTNGMWGNGFYIYGGTYIQESTVAPIAMFDNATSTTPKAIQNATFILNNAQSLFKCVNLSAASVKNCNFIFANPTNLFISAGTNTDEIFENCNFYNAIPNTIDGISITYTDCNFNLASLDEQVGGYIAYTGENVVKTIAGKDYTFTAKLLAKDAVALVDWGFGITEYWKIGATATHADATVDGIFVYGFALVAVTSEGATASSTLKSVASGTILTALSVENDITFRLLVPKDAGFVKVVFDGTEWILADLTPDEDGYFVIHAAYSPSKAADAISIEVTGAYAHTFALTLEAYASAVLADEALADAHNVTYAMVKYVELMSGKTVAVDAPAGYEAQTLVAAPSANTVGLLTNISICHDEAITVGVTGTANTAVKITYANGTVVEGVVGENKMVAISCPALHALAGDLTITAGEESYTYNLANYLHHQTDAEVIAQLQALYNYACYASQYVAVTAQVAE